MLRREVFFELADVLRASKHFFYRTDLSLKKCITMQVQFHLYTLEGDFSPRSSIIMYIWSSTKV